MGSEYRSAALDRLLARFGVGQLRAFSILLGGAVGALARAGLAAGLPHRDGAWPWATFIANLLGALLLGWLVTRLAERSVPTRYWRLLLGTGLAGALTTFSTFEVETIRLAKEGYPAIAVAYPTVSIVLGMVCAVAGVLAARRGRYW